MKKLVWSLLLFLGVCIGCQRKLSAAEVKENLEKAMIDHIRAEANPNGPPPNFKMLDVIYYNDGTNYYCTFTVKLTRPDGTDTTGTIGGKISEDFSKVSRR